VNVLLDTCAFLYWTSGDPRLSARARDVIEDTDNTIFFSVVSAFEIANKQHSGKLTLPDHAERYVPAKLKEFSFQCVDIKIEHALCMRSLVWHHKDPFDLLIISQAICLGMPVLTRDDRFQNYPVTVLW
jgi:PIN domain nuclease of toxin-antitoxin system